MEAQHDSERSKEQLLQELEQLRASHDLLNAILEEVADALTVQDPSGKLLYANEEAARLIGYPSVETLLATPVTEILSAFEMIDETGTPLPMEALPGRRALQGDYPPRLELRFRIRETGEERWSTIQATPVFDENENVRFVVNRFRDITERKTAERRLRESENRYRSLVEYNPDGVFSSDLQGNFTSINPALEAISGYREEELLGKPFGPLILDEHLAIIKHALTKVMQGMPQTVEVTGIRKEGQRRELYVTCIPMMQDERIVGVYGVIQDITERKRAEEERNRLLEEAQHARRSAEEAQQRVSFLAEASNILSASLEYETTLTNLANLVVPHLGDWCTVDILEEGKVRRLAIAHKEPHKVELLRALDRYLPSPHAPHGLYQVLRTGKPEVLTEITDDVITRRVWDTTHQEILRRLGFGSAMIIPLLVGGRTLGAITLALSQTSKRRFDDTTLMLAQGVAQRAAVAVDNARLYREAQKAISVRDLFLSIASHELRTPLTTILGYSHLLQRAVARLGIEDEAHARAIDLIHSQAMRMHEMVDTLLDVSRIQTGRLALNLAKLDIAELTRRLIETLEPTLERHTVAFDVPNTPLIIDGDAMRLEQVLRNLLDNAIKYSPEGGRVHVYLRRYNGNIELSIADEGIGIPAHALPALFDGFYRAPNVQEQSIGGLGLGLYVVKEIVSLHGGTIYVTSAEGKGSTFTVCLPTEGQVAG